MATVKSNVCSVRACMAGAGGRFLGRQEVEPLAPSLRCIPESRRRPEQGPLRLCCHWAQAWAFHHTVSSVHTALGAQVGVIMVTRGPPAAEGAPEGRSQESPSARPLRAGACTGVDELACVRGCEVLAVLHTVLS